MKQKFQDLAIQLALTSNHRVRVGSVLVSKNSVISVGVNSNIKSHPLQAYYDIQTKEYSNILRHLIHAELDTIIKYRKLGIQLPKLKLYVARIHLNGDLVAGFPCPSCESAILDTNIDEIIFSTASGFKKVKI